MHLMYFLGGNSLPKYAKIGNYLDFNWKIFLKAACLVHFFIIYAFTFRYEATLFPNITNLNLITFKKFWRFQQCSSHTIYTNYRNFHFKFFRCVATLFCNISKLLIIQLIRKCYIRPPLIKKILFSMGGISLN